MLILAHTGITLGAAALVAGAVNRRHSSIIKITSWFALLLRYLDIRILLIGSLLPDIIDKPVGQYFFRQTFSNGRIFSHSLLFLFLISAVGFYLYKSRRQTWLLALASGTFMHLVLDEMWIFPKTIFWPFMGIAFEKASLAGWMSGLLESLLSNPAVYIAEIIGFLVLVLFVIALVRRKRVGAFIKYGRAA